MFRIVKIGKQPDPHLLGMSQLFRGSGIRLPDVAPSGCARLAKSRCGAVAVATHLESSSGSGAPEISLDFAKSNGDQSSLNLRSTVPKDVMSALALSPMQRL